MSIKPGTKPILWGRGSSTNVQKVIWTSFELGLEIDHRPLAGEFGGNSEDWFLKLNPNGTVPVWQFGDFVLYESQAIMRHLARENGALYGSNAQEAAYVDCWLDWFSLVFWPPVRMLFLEVVRDKKRSPQDPEALAAIHKIQRTTQLMTDRLSESRYLAGPKFTIADIAMTIGMNRLLGMGIGVEIQPCALSWIDENRTRKGFQRAVSSEPIMAGGA